MGFIKFGCLAAIIAVIPGCGGGAPYFESLFVPDATHDSTGPYNIEAYIQAPEGLERALVRLTREPLEEIFSEIYFERQTGDQFGGRYRAQIPGQLPGTNIFYFLVATDVEGQSVTAPDNAPESFILLSVQDDRDGTGPGDDTSDQP